MIYANVSCQSCCIVRQTKETYGYSKNGEIERMQGGNYSMPTILVCSAESSACLKRIMFLGMLFAIAMLCWTSIIGTTFRRKIWRNAKKRDLMVAKCRMPSSMLMALTMSPKKIRGFVKGLTPSV